MLRTTFRSLSCAILALHLLPVFAGDWPSWRGPHRSGVSDERGLVKSWSPSGENLLWKAQVTARATPVVFDGRVCISGRGGTGPTRHELVACYDAGTGKPLWSRGFPVYNTTVPFTRVGWAALAADPETGYVFAQHVDGQLTALDREGKTVWQHRLGEEYGRGSGYGGRTLIPVVDEDRLVIGIVGAGWADIGPPRQRYMAFDKRTGAVRWISTPAQGPFDDANNQASPTVAEIGGRRLVIGGGADGWLYAIDARTGAPVWRFQVSVRGLNSPPLVVGDTVYAAHSEENPDGGPMGRVVAIDGRGSGDITKTHEVWRADAIAVGFAAPTAGAGRLYVLDNAANLHALDLKTGKPLWEHSLGTIGRAAPVFADGRLYLTEQNGKMLIVEPGTDGAKTLDEETIEMPGEDRTAEVWGSVAVAYGRLYFTTEEGLYCVGSKDAPFKAEASNVTPSAQAAPAADAAPAQLLIVPGEVLAKSDSPPAFEAWSFDAQGRFLRKDKASFSVEGLAATIDANGRLQPASPATTAGKVKAEAGTVSATTQVRLFGPLPWTFDFEQGPVPRHWIGAGPRFDVADLGGKRLHKPPQQTGLQRATVYIGPPWLSGYTIEGQILFTQQGRRAGDLGLLNQGYTLDLMGKKQELQLRTWASELEKSTTLAFPAEPNVWYRMKLRVDVQGERGTARGKVWKASDAEPQDWTITLEDPQAVTAGSPGVYGDSVTDLYWDDVTVRANE